MAKSIKPLRTEAAYQAAVADVGRLWGSKPGTEAGDRLDVLLVLVDAYENEHHEIDMPDPIDAIEERLDALEIDRVGLGQLLGVESGRVSEILNRRRELSKAMIRTLAKELGLSERCLLQPYELSRAYA